MPTVDINGFQMYYEDRGDGEPLLLLHGGTGIGADWRHVFTADPDGYRVIVPDLRGHGRSTNPSKAFTFRQCARDVLSLVDHLALTRVKAVGMSMGAKNGTRESMAMSSLSGSAGRIEIPMMYGMMISIMTGVVTPPTSS